MTHNLPRFHCSRCDNVFEISSKQKNLSLFDNLTEESTTDPLFKVPEPVANTDISSERSTSPLEIPSDLEEDLEISAPQEEFINDQSQNGVKQITFGFLSDSEPLPNSSFSSSLKNKPLKSEDDGQELFPVPGKNLPLGSKRTSSFRGKICYFCMYYSYPYFINRSNRTLVVFPF